MELNNGIIAISTLEVDIQDAEVSLSGLIDLHQSAATAEIKSRVTSIQTWVSDFEAKVMEHIRWRQIGHPEQTCGDCCGCGHGIQRY